MIATAPFPRHIPPRPLPRRRAFRRAWLLSIVVALGCAHATVDDEGNENITGEDPEDEDPMAPSTGGSDMNSESGGFISTGGQNTGGGVSTGGAWIGVGATSSDGEDSGGPSTGGTSSSGTSSGGASTGGSGSGGDPSGTCGTPDLGTYSQATACGQTVIVGGALYECITMYYQAGDCNHTSGVWRCNDFAPNDAAWGTSAWSKIMNCD